MEEHEIKSLIERHEELLTNMQELLHYFKIIQKKFEEFNKEVISIEKTLTENGIEVQELHVEEIDGEEQTG